MVCEQNVPAPSKQPERKAKATTSKTNPGAVARGENLGPCFFIQKVIDK